MSEPDDAPVWCMFLPLEQQGLLVPSTGVAEIIGFAPPRQVEGMPAWLTGHMSWRGVEIPLISMEAALGQSIPDVGVRNRVAVMHTLRDDLTPTFYGVVIQRLPTVVLASERNLETGGRADDSGWVEGAVDLEVGRGMIPSFERLEQALHSLE